MENNIIKKTELTLEQEILNEIEAETQIESRFHPFTLADLYNEKLPEIQWVVKDLIPLGGITAFTGESNSFKSFLTLALAASVVNGEPYLGHFPTTQGRVLIVDEENNRSIIRNRFEALGVVPSLDVLFISQEGFRADIETSVETLRLIIEKEKPVLIILDSLIDIHQQEENDAPKMTAIFRALRKEILTDDSAIIVIHHHRKEQIGQGSRPGQSMRGSSGIYAALDAHISVRRKDSGSREMTVSQEKLRLQEQMKPFKVSLVLADTDGHIAFAYQGEDTSKDDALMKIENAVLDVIFKAEGPMTIKQFTEATGESENAVRAATKGLIARGLVAVVGRVARGAQLFALAITDKSSDDSEDASSGTDPDQSATKSD